jgi:hypothetical protein
MDKKIKIHINKIRNEFHFNIQKRSRMNIFKDKTKYTRKIKHKNTES